MFIYSKCVPEVGRIYHKLPELQEKRYENRKYTCYEEEKRNERDKAQRQFINHGP